MKATGIVRRVDDLGRVVIPKELRRTLMIQEGDSVEIYTGDNGEVIFRKYDMVSHIDEMIDAVVDVVEEESVQNASKILKKLSEVKELMRED